MNKYTFEECQLGLEEKFAVQVTAEMMKTFMMLTGDENPLHMEAGYAQSKGFTDRVVYGMLVTSFCSTLAGMYLPGEKCLIEETSFKYKKPVYVGDVLEIKGTVAEKEDRFNRIKVNVRITNQNAETVVRGMMILGVME